MKNKYPILLVTLGFFIAQVQKFEVYLNSDNIGSAFYVILQLTIFLPSTIANIIGEILQAPSTFLFLTKYVLCFIFAFLLLLPFKKNLQKR